MTCRASQVIMRMNFAICATTFTLLCAPAVGVSAADASALAAQYSCQACHALDQKVVGPSYKEVAAKNAGESGALVRLENKVKSGGSDVGGARAMPQKNCPDADHKALVEWNLTAKESEAV